MSVCDFPGCEGDLDAFLSFRCNYCGGSFCSQHRVPPMHSCSSIDAWKSRPIPTKAMGGRSKKDLTEPPIIQTPERDYGKRGGWIKKAVVILLFFGLIGGSFYLGSRYGEEGLSSPQVPPSTIPTPQTKPTPTPTPIPMGVVSASSSPSGASVYIDGTYKGTTPITISDIFAGSHIVKVALPSYEDWSESVTVSAGVTTSVSPTLTPLKGIISAKTSPLSGAIYIDGRYIGTEQVSKEYPVGPHSVTFDPVSGYHTPKAQIVTVEHGVTLNVVGEYVPLSPAKLEASATQTISGVTPAIYKPMLELDMPLLMISIKNTGESPAERVSISTRIEGVTDWQTKTIDDIGPGVFRNVDLMPIISEEALTGFNESTLRAIQIEIKYTSIEKERTPVSISQPITIYSKNAMPLSETDMIASKLGIPSYHYFFAYYVMPHDPAIRSLATDATTGKSTTDDCAQAIFDALCLKGVSYASDPNDPIGKDVDYCQFPSQTLQSKRGDCDDLSVLYASCLEAVGIESQLVFVPDHVFVGYKCPENNTAYLVETTMIEPFSPPLSPFFDARKVAYEEYNTSRKVVTVVDVEYAWQLGVRSGI